MAPAEPQWLWLVITGCLASFGFGFGTGSNDVANAFATSVGSKTLKMWHAIVLAAIFEFLGALVLGRVSTSTIAGAVADPKAFAGPGGPEAYAYGMVIALAVGFFWQWWASSKGLNVSATHSIIGAILGFAFVWGGPKAVNWSIPDKGSFPPYKGVISIILSWFISPILTAVVSALMFLVIRHGVLRRKHAALLSLCVLPIAVFITTWLNLYFVFTKGAKKMLTTAEKDWSDKKAAWISAAVAGGLAALTGGILVPLLHRRSKSLFDADGNALASASTAKAAAAEAQAAAEGVGEYPHNKLEGLVPGGVTGAESAEAVLHRISGQVRSPTDAMMRKAWMMRTLKSIKDTSVASFNADIHDAIEDDPLVAGIHARAEKFAPQVENNFSYLQVFSAIAVIFAHGANEVGYMAGPLTTIWNVYQTGKLPKSVNAPIWIIVLSAAGLVVGLATYGHHVMRSMGTAMAKLTPTRGFCAELATATVIMVAAQSGLPTSSSQCLVGGIVGVGLCESLKGGINWKLFGSQFASWVGTLAVVALSTAALFAQGIYTPNRPGVDVFSPAPAPKA